MTKCDFLQKNQKCCQEFSAPSHLDVNKLAETFKLLSDPKRLQLVIACLEKPQSVCCLSDLIGMSQPLTSHHLRVLREGEVLTAVRQGKNIFYEINNHDVVRFLGAVAK